MGDPTDVGFVDTHAKGHRGADDQPVLLLEPALCDAPVFGLHPTVVM